MSSDLDYEIESCSKYFEPSYYKCEIIKAGINVAGESPLQKVTIKSRISTIRRSTK